MRNTIDVRLRNDGLKHERAQSIQKEHDMTKEISMKNRRKFPRFYSIDDVYVLHSDFGKVLEIGMGGIVFTYVDKDCQKNNLPQRGTIFNRNDDYLIELPFKTLSDTVARSSSSGKLNIRKRIVIFEDITTDQTEKLERFIVDNVSFIKKECMELINI